MLPSLRVTQLKARPQHIAGGQGGDRRRHVVVDPAVSGATRGGRAGFRQYRPINRT
jgi:hypothetical protein